MLVVCWDEGCACLPAHLSAEQRQQVNAGCLLGPGAASSPALLSAQERNQVSATTKGVQHLTSGTRGRLLASSSFCRTEKPGECYNKRCAAPHVWDEGAPAHELFFLQNKGNR